MMRRIAIPHSVASARSNSHSSRGICSADAVVDRLPLQVSRAEHDFTGAARVLPRLTLDERFELDAESVPFLIGGDTARVQQVRHQIAVAVARAVEQLRASRGWLDHLFASRQI